MKLVLLLAASFLTLSAEAQNLTLNDYRFDMTDIRMRGQTPQSLYSSMNTSLIKSSSSICSNRALVWVNDFKRYNDIDAAKIFLFYTGKTGRAGRTTWWYHVAPMVNDGGQQIVLDPGFPGMINAPLTVEQWLVEFAGTSNCREIRSGQNELIEKMFTEQVFPDYTQAYGPADCYYHVAPAGLWTPGAVASHLLGVDYEGTPVASTNPEIDIWQVYEACKEASSSFLGGTGKKCRRYLGL